MLTPKQVVAGRCCVRVINQTAQRFPMPCEPAAWQLMGIPACMGDVTVSLSGIGTGSQPYTRQTPSRPEDTPWQTRTRQGVEGLSSTRPRVGRDVSTLDPVTRQSVAISRVVSKLAADVKGRMGKRHWKKQIGRGEHASHSLPSQAQPSQAAVESTRLSVRPGESNAVLRRVHEKTPKDEVRRSPTPARFPRSTEAPKAPRGTPRE
ncbi:hypothetical protein LY76DRAFT_356990 [Colletotrichum caudatum]|nr:hypothetical protein LY76DRAFT_356990 [Colletotrichum caudatum]